MTVIKRIVILANSVKHSPGRCVAGRELLLKIGAGVRVGGWLRPVSLIGEGELYAQHCRIEGGGSINLFDVFDVPLTGPADDPIQPENWLIDQQVLWRRVSPLPRARLVDFYENPDGLWIEPGVNSDRVSQAYFGGHPPHQSLYVIPLSDPVIKEDNWNQGRHRLHFRHAQHAYALKITDPLMHAAAPGALPVAACISFTPPFKGFHYKLVASLFW